MQSWTARLTIAGVFITLGLASWIYRPPIWVYPSAAAALFLFYANTLIERVPLYLTNRTTWAGLAALLEERLSGMDTPHVVDLGCGLGGLVAYLAKTHPAWSVVGVETAPGPYLIAKLRTWPLANAEVRFQSLWTLDLSRFNAAYAFLSPAPMARLLNKVAHEMAPGTVFVSNSFWADGQPCDEVAEINDSRSTQLYVRRL